MHMKLSHILYKAADLDTAVREFRALGFQVEYGSKKNPHNALVYFSEGPYIELLGSESPVSPFISFILRLIGKAKVAERFKRWKTAEPGYFELCLENYNADFKVEEAVFKTFSQPYFITKSSRHDPQDRLLKWRMLFPLEVDLPFLMTYFNIDPKPSNFKHPNGYTRVKMVRYTTDEKWIPLLDALCEDHTLKMEAGKKNIEVVFE